MTKGDQKWQHNAKTRSSLTNQCCLGWARLHQVTQRWLYMRTEIWSSNPLCSDRSRLSEQRQVSEAELCSWVSSYSLRFSVFVFLQWVWIKIHHIKEVHVHVRARTHTHTQFLWTSKLAVWLCEKLGVLTLATFSFSHYHYANELPLQRWLDKTSISCR